MTGHNRWSDTGSPFKPAGAAIGISKRRNEAISMRRLVWRRFLKHKLAAISAVVFLLIVLSSVFANALAPYDPAYMDPTTSDDRPTALHPLGTDRIGRDMLSRLIHGGRVSLAVGIVAVAIYMLLGISLGALAGYYGGWVDGVISRIIDIVLSFPTLMMIIVLVGLLGPGLRNIMLVLGLLGWPQTARIVRAEFLKLRTADFVLASRSVGASNRRIVMHHILPNAMGPILVSATFGIAVAILNESGLSFLGLGVQPPIASWGQMLNDAQSITVLGSKPWLWIPPGILILITVLAVNFVGDGLRDALDPQLRR